MTETTPSREKPRLSGGVLNLVNCNLIWDGNGQGRVGRHLVWPQSLRWPHIRAAVGDCSAEDPCFETMKTTRDAWWLIPAWCNLVARPPAETCSHKRLLQECLSWVCAWPYVLLPIIWTEPWKL